ncbi:MAG: sensor histidine kinase [Candidatus Binataceae bacterium]
MEDQNSVREPGQAQAGKRKVGGFGWSNGVRLEALANLAHELRTPIQVLLGYIDILRDEWVQMLPEEPREMVERMNAHVHDLAQTIDNIMEFVLAEANAGVCVDEDVTVRSLMAEVGPYIEAANQKKALDIRFDLREAPEIIRAPRRALRSTLLNLTLNAIKFTESGGVTVAIRGIGNCGSTAVEFAISDTGPGISPALLARASEPFAQLSSSSVRRYRGLGLGLALVRRHVEELGGRFELRASSARGSDLVVTIPTRQATARGGRRHVIPMPTPLPVSGMSKPVRECRR